MADKKVSDLTAATTVAGTDTLLLLQGGAPFKTTPAALPVSSAAQTALDLKAPIASPTFTGAPKVPTASAGTSDTTVASTAFVTALLTSLINGAPSNFDTLGEIATALANDETAAAALLDLVNARSISGGTVTLSAAGTLTRRAKNLLDGSGGPFTVQMPAPTKVGEVLLVERNDASATAANVITVNFPAGATLRGTATTIALLPVGASFEGIEFYADSLTSWSVAASHKPLGWLKTQFAALAETVATVAASGAAQTIPDPSVAGISDITLTANTTLTFPTARAGVTFTLRLLQDATGARTVTWPAGVKWSGGVAPVLSTGAGKQDLLTFTSIDGTTWLGFVAGLDMR